MISSMAIFEASRPRSMGVEREHQQRCQQPGHKIVSDVLHSFGSTSRNAASRPESQGSTAEGHPRASSSLAACARRNTRLPGRWFLIRALGEGVALALLQFREGMHRRESFERRAQ